MTGEVYVAKLMHAVHRLSSLLRTPEFGLATWWCALDGEIADFRKLTEGQGVVTKEQEEELRKDIELIQYEVKTILVGINEMVRNIEVCLRRLRELDNA